MDKIEVKVLNPGSIYESTKMMGAAARLTQHGHEIHSMADFMDLYSMGVSKKTIQKMVSLPHPTIQKFGVINIVVVGASRRFLAQITRHQNEVKFMSASLQYSDYSGVSNFVVPYDYLGDPEPYLAACEASMRAYEKAVKTGHSNDSAGYMAPQGLRNVLIISATPYQWKYMIGLRTCRRNTDETRYVMLKIWDELYGLSPELFSIPTTGPACMTGFCKEGKMSCANPIRDIKTPRELIYQDFPLLGGIK